MAIKLINSLDKFGTAGLFIIAFFSPCCFPLFAVAASTLGLSSIELFGSWSMWIFQSLVLVSLLGLYISYRKHSCTYPLLVAIPSGCLVFYGYNFNDNEIWIYLVYAGMLGLFLATIWNYRSEKIHGTCNTCKVIEGKNVELVSQIICPNCGYQKNEIMPTDACQFFYECEKCNTVLKPKKGDCCVYCSYGNVKCPSIQIGGNCC